MASNPANEIASAIQSMHIVGTPDPEHDINPSTAASQKVPADLVSVSSSDRRHARSSKHHRTYSASSSQSDVPSEPSTIPSDIIAPRPRRQTLPPLPDFRFEQSYLASIKNTQSNWQVAYITIRDQLVWPLVSGVLYNLFMFGWRHWNRETKFQGTSIGARVRKWWWGVNNWKIPGNLRTDRSKLAREAEEFFEAKIGSAQGE